MKTLSRNIKKIVSKDVTGRQVVIYAKIDPKKMIYLENKIKNSDDFDISEFGEVIASCYGTEPTEQVIKKLKEKYNYSA